MKKNRLILLFPVLIIFLGLGLYYLPDYFLLPIREKTYRIKEFGTVTSAHPLYGSHSQAVVFVDPKKIDVSDFARRLATLKLRAIVLNTEVALNILRAQVHPCLDAATLRNFFAKIRLTFPLGKGEKQVVGGIGQGALLPFLQATSLPDDRTVNLSVDFTATLPREFPLCAPYTTEADGDESVLTAAPNLKGQWRSVWSDQPSDQTAILVRGLPETLASIVPYETPLDTAFINHIPLALGVTQGATALSSIIEVPASAHKDTVTIFYSGDGGWRDLDRIIAEKMAKEGYPVVGIDTLRDFWTRKSPEQTAAELSQVLSVYRNKWQAKSFVLAGYSFGADLLPIVLNKLPPKDRDSVRLLVLLAFAEDAEFEIHVSGWLGKGGGEYKTVPAIKQVPAEKILCVYGEEEKAESGCLSLVGSKAQLLELPGGHHFDEDYEKLTRLILTSYRKAGVF